MAQILVHGVSYEMPESFTLKEMRIVERYTGGHAADDGWEMSKIAATIHIAIARAKPALSFEEIEATIDALPVEDLETVLGAVEAGQIPPAQSNSESNGSLNGASEESSDLTQESETHESFGSQDLAGFQSFHSRSAT